ncbi:MAG: hypothetical protein HN368_04740 [Spirochaetales bacterium]|nr:hypothetical protein [Spirochaetales bacterium]
MIKSYLSTIRTDLKTIFIDHTEAGLNIEIVTRSIEINHHPTMSVLFTVTAEPALNAQTIPFFPPGFPSILPADLLERSSSLFIAHHSRGAK